MYHANYYLLNGHFTEEFGIATFSSLSPFKYDYNLNIIFASLKENKRIVDFEKRMIVDVMEESNEGYNSAKDGYFSESGVFVKYNDDSWPNYDIYMQYGSYENVYERSSLKFPETDEKHLWVYQDEGKNQEIECIDMQSDKVIWQWYSDTHQLSHRATPTKIGSILVHNLGFESSSNLKGYVETFNGTLVGIELDTGQELWRSELKQAVANYINFNERLILSYLGFVIELDPKTGEELNRVDTHLPEAHIQGIMDRIAVHDLDDYLVFISSVDKKLSVHDRETLEQVQIIDLPMIPVSYGIDAIAKPVKFQNTWNMKVSAGYQDANRPSNDMLMQLSLCKPSEEPTVVKEEKPPHKISVISEPQNQESYRIDLDAQTPDQLIRLAEVEVALIPGNHGKTMWGAPDINPKFNGKIAFYGTLPENIDETEIERARSYLKLLKEYWDELAAGDMGPYGSIKGTLIDLSCYLNGEKIT